MIEQRTLPSVLADIKEELDGSTSSSGSTVNMEVDRSPEESRNFIDLVDDESPDISSIRSPATAAAAPRNDPKY